MNHGAQWSYFRNQRYVNSDTLGQLNASSVQHILRHLDKSFAAFFRRLKAGERAVFPRFKSRQRFHNVEYTYGDGCKLRQNEQGRRSFSLQNVGETHTCYHRAILAEAKIKHAVIKQVGERWYVCLMLDLPEPEKHLMRTGKQISIDVGLKSLVALSTGELIEKPRWLRESLAKLRRFQRHASRQIKGSHHQQDTYRQIARLHEQVANQRADYLHKDSHRLVMENDLIAIEHLSLGYMNRSGQLSFNILGRQNWKAQQS